MRHEHGRYPPIRQNCLELVAEGAAEGEVEGGKWLVEQHEGRLDGKGSGQGHTLPLPARQLPRMSVLQASEAESFNRFGRASITVGPRVIPEPKGNVRPHAEVREQGIPLEDVTDASKLRRHMNSPRRIEENPSVHRDAARFGAHEPCETLEGQRLPGSGRSKEHADAVSRRPSDVESEGAPDGANRHVQPIAHVVAAPSRPARKMTAHEIAVSAATRASASALSPVCTAV